MTLRSLKQAAKRIGRTASRALPLAALEYLVRRDVVVFVYHVVDHQPLPHIRHLYSYKSPEEFESDIVYLRDRYHLLSWEELLERRAQRRCARRPAAMITFDDGMSQCFTHVRPILLRHQVPCVFFVATSLIDNQEMFYRHKVSLCLERMASVSDHQQTRLLAALGRELGLEHASAEQFTQWIKGLGIADDALIDRACRVLALDVEAELRRLQPYLTKDQLRQLHADGFTIGGHSVRHEHLARLEDHEAEHEMVQSCRFVSELLGTESVPFAFPFSAHGVSRSLLAAVASRHPWIPVMFGVDDLEIDETFIINRIPVDMPTAAPGSRSSLGNKVHETYVNHVYKLLRSRIGCGTAVGARIM